MPLLNLTSMNWSFPDVFPIEAEGSITGTRNSEGAFLSVTWISEWEPGKPDAPNLQGRPHNHLVLSPAYLSDVLQNLDFIHCLHKSLFLYGLNSTECPGMQLLYNQVRILPCFVKKFTWAFRIPNSNLWYLTQTTRHLNGSSRPLILTNYTPSTVMTQCSHILFPLYIGMRSSYYINFGGVFY